MTKLTNLSKFLSDDKNADILEEIREEVITTRCMVEDSVESNAFFNSDAADSPSATDD